MLYITLSASNSDAWRLESMAVILRLSRNLNLTSPFDHGMKRTLHHQTYLTTVYCNRFTPSLPVLSHLAYMSRRFKRCNEVAEELDP